MEIEIQREPNISFEEILKEREKTKDAIWLIFSDPNLIDWEGVNHVELVSLIINKFFTIKRTVTMWLLYGPIPCVYHEEVTTSKWSSLVFGRSCCKVMILQSTCIMRWNKLSKWWMSYISTFWEAITFRKLDEYHWYSKRPILLISNVISNLVFEYLMNIGCRYSGRSRLFISNVISYHKFE